MRSTVLVAVLLAAFSHSAFAQSQPTVPASPPILGNFTQGKYSNPTLGIQFQLPEGWQIDNIAESERFSSQLPRRMHLHFKSNDDAISLSASPLDPDEKLGGVFGISLRGVMDGGGFQTVGKRTKETWQGGEMINQKLKRKLPSGTETGTYRAFSLRGFYISILDFGPPATEAAREGVVKSLQPFTDDHK